MSGNQQPLPVPPGDTALHVAGNGQKTSVFDVQLIAARLERDPREAARDAIRMLHFLVHVITNEEARRLTTTGPDVARLREAAAVGECFLNSCNSAWAAGEPSHRVQTMLDRADDFRAALDALSATPAQEEEGVWVHRITRAAAERYSLDIATLEHFGLLVGSPSTPQPVDETERLRDAVIADIAGERRRQIEAEGWTPEHDDEHDDGQMATAAACYAYVASLPDRLRGLVTGIYSIDNISMARELWPWARSWWKPKDRRYDLVRAGALIVAEIERIDRAALTDTKPSRPMGDM